MVNLFAFVVNLERLCGKNFNRKGSHRVSQRSTKGKKQKQVQNI